MTTTDWSLLTELAHAPFTEPRLLGSDRTVHLVEDGAADLFAVRTAPDGTVSRQHFVARFPAASVFPSAGVEGEWQLKLVPLPGTRLRELDLGRLAKLEDLVRGTGGQPSGESWCAHGDLIAVVLIRAVDRGLQALTDALRLAVAPRDAAVLRPREIVSVQAERSVVGGRPCWLRLADGVVRKNGEPRYTVTAGQEAVFLGRNDWVLATEDSVVELLSTYDLLLAGDFSQAISHGTARLMATVRERAAGDDTDFLRTLEERKHADRVAVAVTARRALGALGSKASVDGDGSPAAQRGGAWAAEVLRVVTEHASVTVVEPADRGKDTTDSREELRAVARNSGIQLRQVRLRTGWWREDGGPFIGWRRAGDDLVAVPLLFSRGRYWTVDPQTRARTAVDAAAAGAFDESATLPQLPLPAAATLKHLLRWGLLGNTREIRSMLVTGTLVAALGLATPVLIGTVLSHLVRGDLRELPWNTVLYAASAIVAAALGVVLNLRTLRFEDRFESGVQLALWDRLIRLPVRFFTKTTSGALANKVLGLAYARQALNGLVTRSLLALLTAGAGLVFVFAVDAFFAWIGAGLVLGVVVLSVVLGRSVARRQRAALPLEHQAAATTNEIFTGITKIKLAAAEHRAFSRWAEATVGARSAQQKVRHVQSLMAALAVTLPIAGQLVMFAVMAGPLSGKVPVDRFFALNAGFALLLQSMLTLLTATVDLVAVLPRIEGLSDVLSARPEYEPSRFSTAELGGEIEVMNLTFAYPGEDTPVLDDVSLRVRPGQFVAVVGPSGSGKSTLLRLLLGFEAPRSGAVLYDGQDLAELDVQAVRRQCGVVLQDGQLFGGTIRENICGANPLPLDQVWEAAKMAGLDEDIGRMPMGMNSLVSFGGGTLSVGQRQRVLIARSLVSKPRVLYFDEATSALDNRTQEIVTASTQQLAATRFVIAHRLSTVANADVIVVLDRGRIVQQGTYRDLFSDTGGLFHQLAKRQLWEASAGETEPGRAVPA
ncbi:NHLM bacteriocin system ABC transporter, ATP-binding protein [Amycolatopsis xylanica]|uniref:NHLM bacteriocin system ABC transporter, ATP-binding protein n=1 Tax=Amycolatopsis xylanica TaxID=589385 RepID=A0A1H3PJP0_9PSEU|nr:ATP-binding cassette domain-containing protein [Amycolatopsis xylanica]SDZ01412.1 NHLM bacteriocin system ABC transporter, ATP-binding protein [Amycolatopsis xylanica]